MNEKLVEKITLANAEQLAEITHKQWSDFLTTVSSEPFAGKNANGGYAAENGAVSVKHPGSPYYASSTTANACSGFTTNQKAVVLSGGYKTTCIFRTKTITGITRRIGFHNSIDNNAPTDGAYCRIVDGTLVGMTANNGVTSATQTSYTVVGDTWYRLKVELNSDATKVTYTLYADDSDTVLWTDTLSTNIPGTDRKTGCGDICSYSIGAVTYMGEIDYIDIITVGSRRV